MANRQRQEPPDLPNDPQALQARISELERFRDLYDEAPVGYHELDMEGRIVSVNRTELRMLGYEAGEMLGRHVWEFVIEQDEARKAVQAKLSGSSPAGRTFERAYRRKDGSAVPVLIEDHLLHDAEGRIIGVRSTVADITERKRVDEALRASEKRYRSLFENMLDGFAYCRMLFEDHRPLDFVYLEVNGAFERLTGLKNVVGKRVTEVIPGIRETAPELFEMYGRVALTGRPERCETYLKPLGIWLSISAYSPQKEYFVAVFENITERKRMQEAIDALALVDDMTGLYNRRGFTALAEQQLKIAHRAKRKMVLAFIDLDGLKAANDQYGHLAGDGLLCDTARMLRKTYRESDIMARIGGDEFVVFMVDLHDIAPADLTSRLRIHVKERNQTAAGTPLSLSVGLAEYDPANPCNITDLLQQADSAMYEEKRRKRA